jgi:hypothetical protein
LRHHRALACAQLPSSTTAPGEARQRHILVGQCLALAIDRDERPLPDRMCRAEIEHAPVARLHRLAQRMTEIAPGEARPRAVHWRACSRPGPPCPARGPAPGDAAGPRRSLCCPPFQTWSRYSASVG